ncbi:hypothetical protein D2E23_0410 [Bifidobacterium callimiconis]|uniref:Uncharacterized protein n=1 Tax=Bifidobacterium callimiconis TaxID=2306973 RepID=A0A430FIT0_9BIFI|nr:hypothetical protein D2E23_0410 [Bifidobacterium callimiconis]
MPVTRVVIDSPSDVLLARLTRMVGEDPESPSISNDEPVTVTYYPDLDKTVVSYRRSVLIDGGILASLFTTSRTGETDSSPTVVVPDRRAGSK